MRLKLLLPALLLLIALPATAAQVEVKFDSQADFSGYETYTWLSGNPAHREGAQETIMEAVERELASEGLRPVAEEGDLYVAAYVLPGEHTLEDLAHPSAWDYWTGVRTTDAYGVGGGTLVVDLVDGRTDQVVWRVLSSGSVKGSAKQIEKRLPRAISKMFDSYPPQTR